MAELTEEQKLIASEASIKFAGLPEATLAMAFYKIMESIMLNGPISGEQLTDILAELAQPLAELEERCNGCGLGPEELSEYKALALDENHESATIALRREEGTYNTANGHFWCTSCYIRAGQPLGVAQ